MINVNQITATLAKLGDPQLQQYAEMHKNDPYVMALAMSESNRRKQMRDAAQAPQDQGQGQPTVVDQMVAEMAPQQLPEEMPPQQLPEEMGIGQLPAGDMNFAGGGIVAFADGGDVERYNGTTGSLTGGSIFDQLDQQKAAQLAQLNSQLAMIESQLRAAATSKDPQAIQTYAQQAQAIRNQISAVRESAGNRAEVVESLSKPPAPSPTRAESAMPPAAINQPEQTATLNRAQINQAEQAARTDPAVYGEPIKVKDKGKDETKREAPANKAAAATTTAAGPVDPFSMEAILKAQEQAMRGVDYQYGAAKNEAVGLANLYETQAEARLANRKKEIEEEGDIYKGREDRLKKRQADLDEQGKQNKNLAFLNAGLAIMSTPGNLGTAIGKGAQVGTALYASGLKDLRAAQQRLEDANDNIEELRLNRKDMNKKEIRELEKERDSNVNKGKELLLGLAKDRLGVDEKGATELFKTYMTGQKTIYEQKEQTKRTNSTNASYAANRPYDIQGELAKAVLADDEPRTKKLTQVLETIGEAKKPGLDLEAVKKFENLPGVKNMQTMLSGLRMQTNPDAKTIERIRNIEAQLAAKARDNSIDPARIGIGGSGLASPTGGRTIDFNAIP